MLKNLIALGAALAVLAAMPAAHAADPAPGTQVEQQADASAGSLKYWLWLPKDPPPTGAPLLVFLHGAGERGGNLALVKKHGPPKLVESTPELQSFIIVSPQCPPEQWWNIDHVKALVDAVAEKYKPDPARRYLTGLSMGGYATWAILAKHPDYFAAAIPICGGGQPANAEKFKNVPLRVFHGAKDEAVPLIRSQEMVDALKKAEAKDVELKVFPDLAHDSWTPVYADPKTYEWLLSQKK